MAHALQAAGIGTLLVDLFTDRESPDAPFDLGQSVRRLSAACAWAGEQPEAASLPILADALEEAGCDDPAVLAHARDIHQPHVRGCWVCDLVLGKE